MVSDGGLIFAGFMPASLPMRPAFVAFIVCLLPGLSQACPSAPDHADALSLLFEQIQASETPGEAQELNGQLWELWTDAPDATAQEMLDRGMGRRSSYDFLGALQDFDALVAYCPDYAEGYNQRAFVHYLRGDYRAALVDLDLALARSMNHLGALSGKGLSLMALGHNEDARQVLEFALSLNPWLPERALLAPDGPLGPKGTDL